MPGVQNGRDWLGTVMLGEVELYGALRRVASAIHGWFGKFAAADGANTDLVGTSQMFHADNKILPSAWLVENLSPDREVDFALVE
jgi:hypothetical protein